VNLLEAARTVEAKPKILLIGSGEEYGFVLPTDLPIREDTPLRPGNVYAATKAAQGMLGQIYARAYGMEIVIVRAFNHIGTGQPDTFVVASFCRQVAEIEAGIREPVLYTGDLSARRDITDVRDIVKAYALLALKGKIGVIYNVGSGKAVEIKDVLELIRVKAAVPFGIERDPERLRPSDTPAIEADISRLTSETGWEPEISLETSVTDVLGYWREKIGRAG
jgi:GDP-4-dehydro-6-deoxy-D-mannose reductase